MKQDSNILLPLYLQMLSKISAQKLQIYGLIFGYADLP